MANKDIDQISGIETTGHEWDGLKELNNPLPRWWLWTFYVCCAWAVVYWVLMPSWPLVSDYTRGVRGHSQRAVVMQEVAAMRDLRAENGAGLADAELAAIQSDEKMLDFAMANGRAAFGDNCAPCHGSGGAGAIGYPNLNDDSWLWGGKLADISYTIQHGIRNGSDDARTNEMPAFGRDELLEPAQVNDVVEYVVSLSGRPANAAAAERGKALFAEQCVTCHGENAKGNPELGAPNLTDDIWLYGGDRAAIRETVHNSRGGVMPAWKDRLSPETIKQLTIYVHALGGGR